MIRCFKGTTPAGLAAWYLPADKAIEALSTLLELRASMDNVDSKGNTLLHLACLGEDRPQLCRFLVELGMNANVPNKAEGNTPFILASFLAKPQSCAYLGKVGGDMNVTNIWGWTPIQAAAPFGSSGTLKICIDLGANPNERIPHNLKLRLFSRAGLLMRKAKKQLFLGVIVQNLPGVTPLHTAALLGDVGAVKLLLDAGADPKAKNANGLDARDICRLGPETAAILELLTLHS